VLLTAAKETYLNPQTEHMEEAVRFFDATGQGEIYPPADNPRVITVGDGSEESSKGPTLDNRAKPDTIIEDSRAYFSDGEMSAGASNAAAYLTGVVAVLKAQQPRLAAQHIFRLMRDDTGTSSPKWERIQAPRKVATQVAPGSYRYYSGPTRAPLVRVPDSNSVILEGRRFRITGDLAGRSLSITRQPPKSTPAPSPAQSQVQTGPVWHTPSRERLAQVIAAAGENR
jgi:hypothetical protein